MDFKNNYEKCKYRVDLYLNVANDFQELNRVLKNHNWMIASPDMQHGVVQILNGYRAERALTDRILVDHIREWQFENKNLAIKIGVKIYRLKYLNKYSFLIENSLIQFLQEDFVGAINTLLPVLEGVIRNYSVSVHNSKPSEIVGKKKILRALKVIQEDYYNKVVSEYENCGFNINQESHLKKIIRQQCEIWDGIFNEYLENNLYLDTRGEQVEDKLNRHLIMHCFETVEYYTESNYMKLFCCLDFFISYFEIIEYGPGNRLKIKKEDYIEKLECYIDIRKKAEQLCAIKSRLFRNQKVSK